MYSNTFIHEFRLQTGQTPSIVQESKLHVNLR